MPSRVSVAPALVPALIACFACLALPAPLRAAKAEQHSFVSDFNEKLVFDDEIMQVVHDSLLVGVADNVMIFVVSCHGEGFTVEGAGRLNGNWSVSAARLMKKTARTASRWQTDLRLTFSENQQEGGKTGIKLNTENPPDYGHGWGAQLIRAIKTDATHTATQLHDFAKNNDAYIVGTGGPTFTSGGTGANAKLRVNDAKNLAAFWQDACKLRDMVKTSYQTLRDAGYAAVDIDFAYNSGNIGISASDRTASRDALLGSNGQISKLRANLMAATGEKRALIILWAHGNIDIRKAPKKPDAVPDQPKQGKVETPSSPPESLEVDAEFADAFFSDLPDDPLIDRSRNPSFLLSTSEETYGGPVSITLDGIPAGLIVLSGSSNGGFYELILSDAVWSQLHSSGALDDDNVAIAFGFPSGSFRVATEWDFAIAGRGHYGFGLAGPALLDEYALGGGSGPSLGAYGPYGIVGLALLMIGAAFMAIRRIKPAAA